MLVMYDRTVCWIEIVASLLQAQLRGLATKQSRGRADVPVINNDGLRVWEKLEKFSMGAKGPSVFDLMYSADPEKNLRGWTDARAR